MAVKIGWSADQAKNARAKKLVSQASLRDPQVQELVNVITDKVREASTSSGDYVQDSVSVDVTAFPFLVVDDASKALQRNGYSVDFQGGNRILRVRW